MGMTAMEGGTPIVMTGNGNDGLLGGGGGIGALLIGALLFGGGLGGFGNRGGAAVAEGAQLGQLSGIQSQLNSLQSSAALNPISCELDHLQESVCSGNMALQKGISDNANTYLQGQAALQTAQASANFTTLQSINGLGQVITAQNNQAALQQLNSFNGLNTTLLQSFNENSRDNANSFNAIQAQNATLAAQMAACCCEIKQAICLDGQSTRALINDINLQNVQSQLADAKSQIGTLNSNIYTQNALNAQAATIITHLKPATVVV